MHILEAGYRSPDQPLVLLLHGFPELAFSWRKLMPLIAARGYHVIAPDLRGYGVTTGWDGDYDGDLASFRLSRLVRDVLALRAALGHQRVGAVVGHDFGSPLAAWCALLHPHIFGCVALLSAPFPGPPRPGRDPWPHIDAPCPRCSHRASIISATTPRATRIPTCTPAPRASALSCGPTFTAKATTGRTIGRTP
jgi:non-specific protein-tyrosine kinase